MVEDISERKQAMSGDIQQRIQTEVDGSPVVLFMKGTKEAPQCGFSAQVTQVLGSYGVNFKDIDVLADWDIREGIKSFSSWPTIPQLYVNGEFVGGCDITMELHRKGNLEEILNKAKG